MNDYKLQGSFRLAIRSSFVFDSQSFQEKYKSDIIVIGIIIVHSS
jgi:hypothetical protein